MLKNFIRKSLILFLKPVNYLFSNLRISGLFKEDVHFIVERKDWSIKWDGIQVCEKINFINPKACAVTTIPIFKSRKIIHYGSQFLWEQWHELSKHQNKTVVNFYHGSLKFERQFESHIQYFLKKKGELDKVIVANSLVEKRLLGWGFNPKKLVKIPIGVDTSLFTPPTKQEKLIIKEKLGIEKDEIVIGSFQKDGEGWGAGLTPKLIKGPDIFVELVGKISKDFKIKVLLTGPARGYIIGELEKRNIRVKHVFYENYTDIVEAYKALDFYLMTSREEGGPKAILEAAACKVPIISSNVGMAPDFFTDNCNKLLFEPEETDKAVKIFYSMVNNELVRNSNTEFLHNKVKTYDWENISKKYWDLVYQPLLREL